MIYLDPYLRLSKVKVMGQSLLPQHVKVQPTDRKLKVKLGTAPRLKSRSEPQTVK